MALSILAASKIQKASMWLVTDGPFAETKELIVVVFG
jgi:hypothetical protein